MIQVHVVQEHDLPAGHRWMRVQMQDGRAYLFVTEAVAERYCQMLLTA